MVARLQEHYEKVVRPELIKEFSYENLLQAPRIDKIVINMGVGEATSDSKKINAAVAELTAIAGQKPVITKARKSIATFKLREGMNIGCKVTLRRDRMYECLDRLISIALPRVRERAYPQADHRWSTRPRSSGVVLLSYEEAGTDSVPARVP